MDSPTSTHCRSNLAFVPHIKTSELFDSNTAYFIKCWRNHNIAYTLIIDSQYDNWHMFDYQSDNVPPWFVWSDGMYLLDPMCTAVKSDCLTHISENMFYACRNTSFTLANVQTVEPNAFSYCYGSIKLEFDKNCESHISMFQHCNIVRLELFNVTYLEPFSFYKCNIHQIILHNTHSIKCYAFAECPNLHSIDCVNDDNSKTSIDSLDAVKQCHALQCIWSHDRFAVKTGLDVGETHDYRTSAPELLFVSPKYPCSSYSFQICLIIYWCLQKHLPKEMVQFIMCHTYRQLAPF